MPETVMEPITNNNLRIYKPCVIYKSLLENVYGAEGRHASCGVCDASVAAQLILGSHSSTFCLARRRRVHASFVIYCHADSCFSAAHVFITFHFDVLFRCLSVRNAGFFFAFFIKYVCKFKSF